MTNAEGCREERGTEMNRKMTIRLMAVCSVAVGFTLLARESGDASSKVQQLEKEMKPSADE